MTDDASPVFIEPTEASGRRLVQRGIDGPVVMLNLLRLREIADYSSSPALMPATPITGREAYERYVEHTLPFLAAAGGELELMAGGGHYFIGPPDERWDLVLLVRHASIAALMSMASDEHYLIGVGHRVAATADSRILPLEALDRP